MRPRVLLLVTLAETGGAQTYLASLLPAIAERFDVTVAAHGTGPVAAAAAAAGAPFVALRHICRPVRPLADARGAAELLALMRRLRPDIVHANSSKMGVLARLTAPLAGVPVRIFTVHGWAFLSHRGLAAHGYRLADRLMRPLTTVTICVAERELQAGLRAGTCDPARTVVVHNGVALDVPRAQPGRADGPVRLITVGRLRRPKDPLTFARALAGLPGAGFRAEVVGEGPDARALSAELARLHLDGRVELVGDRDDVAARLARAQVFVLASRSEGLPMSVLEAMAAGLPVVASDVGGVRELVVDGETGLLVAPGDPDAMAAALRRLIAEPPLRARLGAAGRARAESRFDLAGARRAHVELYERALARAGRAPPGGW